MVNATKFGIRVDEFAKDVTHYGDPRTGDVTSYVQQNCGDSLRRLNTDVIDLSKFHVGYYSPGKTGPNLEVLEELIVEGKIPAYGWSTDNPEGAHHFS